MIVFPGPLVFVSLHMAFFLSVTLALLSTTHPKLTKMLEAKIKQR